MKRDNWPVEEFGIRPAGDPDKCFYCGIQKGMPHALDCVIRQRSVVVKITVEMVRMVPEDWEPEQINFHMNESSWCATNIIGDLEEQSERMGCLCGTFTAEYIREATAIDEEKYALSVVNEKS